MAKTKAEIEAAWWEADWSWAGLAGKWVGENGGAIHGGVHGEQNLQDYWRRDPATGAVRDDDAMERAGELVHAPGGALWHVAHVPMRWRNGADAKAGWDAGQREKLAGLIVARVVAATETRTDSWCDAEGPDGRAQLSGTVLLDPPTRPSGEKGVLHLVCDGAGLPAWDARGQAFGPGFRCQNANFFEVALFANATFSGDASFDSATFSGGASFIRATFSGEASFVRATFSGDTRFDSATFSGDARFDSATFSGDPRFVSATFSGYTGFDSATFSGDARFDSATFSGDPRFDFATFSGDANLSGATFSGRPDFSGATFSGDARFDNATFSGFVSFALGECKAGACFDNARFTAQPGSQPHNPAVSFAGRRFRDITSFDWARFYHRADFKAAIFERNALFTNLTLPATPALWQGMFDQAQFKELANFRGTGCQGFAVFDGAVFGGELQFDDSAEPDADRQFRVELAAALALPAPGKTPAEAEPPADTREAALKHLERGCRVLKQAMAKAADKQREQMFFAFELIARREQTHVARSEKLASWLYEKTSDYGRSIALPLGWLALLYLVCGSLYGLLALAQQFPPQVHWAELWTLSAHRMLPIGAWNVEKSPLQELIFAKGDNPLAFAARSLASLQSLISVVLIFQLLLVIRRRFQIS